MSYFFQGWSGIFSFWGKEAVSFVLSCEDSHFPLAILVDSAIIFVMKIIFSILFLDVKTRCLFKFLLRSEWKIGRVFGVFRYEILGDAM